MYPRWNPHGCQHLELCGSKSRQGLCHRRHIPEFLVQRLQLLRRKRRTALSYEPLTKSCFITQWCKLQIVTSAHGCFNSDPSVNFHQLRMAYLQLWSEVSVCDSCDSSCKIQGSVLSSLLYALAVGGRIDGCQTHLLAYHFKFCWVGTSCIECRGVKFNERAWRDKRVPERVCTMSSCRALMRSS